MSILKSFARKFFSKMDENSPYGWVSLSGGGFISDEQALTISSVWRAVSYVSSTIGCMGANVVVKDGEVISKTLPEDRISKLFDISPNPLMTAQTFKELIPAYAMIKGNFYAEIEFNRIGEVIALWPLRPELVEPIVSNKRLFYKVIHSGENGEHVYLPSWKMFHVKGLGNGIVGSSVISMARRTLSITISAEQFEEDFYANKALPSGVLEVPNSFSDKAKSNLKESWIATHGGRKTGGVAVLEQGAKYNSIKMPFSDMQFLESRKHSISEIARWFSVPPAKLYDRQNIKNDNAENENIYSMSDAIMPWVKRIESEANLKLLNKKEGGRSLDIQEKDLIRYADLKSRGEFYRSMIKSCVMKPNHARAMEGWARHEDGDTFFIEANNLVPIKKIDQYLGAKDASNSK